MTRSIKRTLIALVAFSISLQAFALDLAEKHRLGAYLTFIVVTSKDIGGGTPSTPDNKPAGGVCGECNGLGKVGDGVVMFTCGACGGTGKASSATPESEPGTPDTPEEDEQEPTPPVQETSSQSSSPPADEVQITDLKQSRWNWQGKGSVPTDVMRSHLAGEHDISPSSLDKMSRQELEALHNLLHNEEVRAKAPAAKAKSSSGCPGGNCPTSRSSSSSTRYGLFGRRR